MCQKDGTLRFTYNFFSTVSPPAQLLFSLDENWIQICFLKAETMGLLSKPEEPRALILKIWSQGLPSSGWVENGKGWAGPTHRAQTLCRELFSTCTSLWQSCGGEGCWQSGEPCSSLKIISLAAQHQHLLDTCILQPPFSSFSSLFKYIQFKLFIFVIKVKHKWGGG